MIFHYIHKAELDALSKLYEIFNKNYEDNWYPLIGLINIKGSLIENNYYYYNYFYIFNIKNLMILFALFLK